MTTETNPRRRHPARSPLSERRMPLYLGPDSNALLSLKSARRILERAAHPAGIGSREPSNAALTSAPAANDVEDVRVRGETPMPRTWPPQGSTAPFAREAETEFEDDTLEDRGRPNENGSTAPLDVVAGSRVLGRRVMSSEGETVGAVRDVMVDLVHGRLAYVVVACALGARGTQRLFAVPWSAFTDAPTQEYLTLNMTRQVLLGAPSFASDRWPDLSDPDAARTLHAYYGQPGYWEVDRHT